MAFLCPVATWAATYYSYKPAAPFEINFSTLSEWNTNPGGGGSNPTAADLTNGLHTFIVQNGYTVTVNQNISVAALTVGTGISGSLIIGNDGTARTITIGTTGFSIANGAAVSVGAFNAIHSITCSGPIAINGNLDLRNNSSQGANLSFTGTYTISGTGTEELNNVTFTSGTVTAGKNLTIAGNLIINSGATFTSGSGRIHNLLGSWTQIGTGNHISVGSTINFAAALVQSIPTNATFNNVNFNGGGLATVSGSLTVNGSFSVTSNTTFTTGSNHTLNGNFLVATGSTFSASGGTVSFNGTGSQSIDVSGSVTFNALSFAGGGASNPKTIIGNLSVNNTTIISASPLAQVGGSGNHIFRNTITQNGSCTFSGSVTITAGTLQDTQDDVFSLGTAELIIAGGVNLAAGDALTLNNNLTISSGSLTINTGSSINDASGTATLTLGPLLNLFVRGTNNFPTGFATYNLDPTSIVRYDLAGPQTVRGGLTYGTLLLASDTKTLSSSATVLGNLDLGGTVNFNIQNHTLTWRGATIVNSGTRNGSISGSAGSTLVMGGQDINQTIQNPGTGSYIVDNFTVEQATTPTAVRTRFIQGNLTVNGNVSITNTGGDPVNLLIFDLTTFQITKGSPSGSFSVGDNVSLSSTGANNFQTTIASFTTVSLSTNSIVRFAGTNQDLPAITYGSVHIQGNGDKTALGAMDVNGDFLRISGNANFVGGAFTHTVAGIWNINSLTLFNSTGTTIVFDGADQNIFLSSFNNVTFAGSGTKTLNGNLTINGNLSILDAVTVDANTRALTLNGNFVNSGTGIFTQSTGSILISGNSAVEQTISTNAASTIGNLLLQRPVVSANTTTRFLSNVRVAGNVTFSNNVASNSNILNLDGRNLSIGGNWVLQGTSSQFIHGNGTLTFNGAAAQTISNIVPSNYFNLLFSNSGTKTLNNNPFTIQGNVTINSTTITTGQNLFVAGNWNNTGTFNGTGASAVNFNGGNQNISASTFNNLVIAGTNTKTLTGAITVQANLTIETGATLDVSASNFGINLDNNFLINGTGQFNPRNGTVTISNTSNVNTGGIAAGKRFFNLTTTPATGFSVTLGSDVGILNDLTISSGNFNTSTFNLEVAGNLTNNATFIQGAGSLTLNATTGTKNLKSGGSLFRNMVVNASGAVVQLTEDLTLNTGNTITITNGELLLNSRVLAMAGNITLTGGRLNVNEGANLRLSNGNSISNNGGTFTLVGTPSQVATISRNGVTGNYTYTQTAGTIEARYYLIANTGTNGFTISGGTIDPTNNFSNGTFSGGAGNAYLTLTGLNFADFTASNIVINAGPTYNIARTSGTGQITFQDALGARAGNAFRAPGTTDALAIFVPPAGAVTWDGGAGDGNWNSPLNWSNDLVPTAGTLVYLNHAFVPGAYTVTISSAPALAARVVIEDGTPNAINLTLNGNTLTVGGSVVIGPGCTVTQTNPADQISVGENWLNSGTFNEGTATVRFNGSTGTHTIVTGGISDPFFNLTFNATGAVYQAGAPIRAANNLTVTAGTFDAAGNNLEVAGNWSVLGTFIPRNGTVTFNGTGTQTISGGTFNNLTTASTIAGSTKNVNSTLTISGAVTIGVNTILNGGTQILNVAGNWINDVGPAGFTQTGTGAIFFNGANQTIGLTGAATTFQNIYMTGTGNKVFNRNATINGDFSILAGVNNIDINTGIAISGTAPGTLSMSGGVLRVFDAFPAGFGTYSLTAGTVTYISNSAQSVFNTNYFNLNLQRVSSPATTTKTAAGNINVAGTLNIVDVGTTLAMGNNTLTVTGGYTHFAGAPQITWGASGTFVHDGANWAISPNVTGFNNLILSGSGTKTMGANLAITGDVQVNTGVTLAMSTFGLTGTGAKSFTLNNLATLTTAIVSPATAFPASFGTYSLGANSNFRLIGAGEQRISNAASYGNFDIANSGGAAVLLGNITINGNLAMTGGAPTLSDNGFNLTLNGATNNIRNYVPTAGTTVTFSGDNQAFNNSSPGSPAIQFQNVVFAGTGTKTNTTNDFEVLGNLTIDTDVTLTTNRNVTLTGNLTNNGTLTQTANTFSFTGGSAQALNVGGNNTFFGMYFSGAGTKTFSTHGFTVGNGTFDIENTTVNLGALSHRIASQLVNFIGTGNWVATSANLEFNRLGAQSIPALNCANFTISGSGTKTLTADITVRDVTVNTGSTLDVDVNNNYTITTTGSFLATGTFQQRSGLVAFESNNTDPQSISVPSLNTVTFNQSLTANRTYSLTSNVNIQNNLTIGTGAFVDLNSRNLTMGTNTVNSTVTVAAGATLEVDGNANLLFNCSNGDATLNSNGTFRMVGTAGNIATLSRSAGAGVIFVNINAGSTIHARFYQFQFVSNTGVNIASTATVDNTNNFSDGTFTGLNNTTGIAARYINFNSNSTPTTTINNVTFNYTGTPQVGFKFNVARAAGASLITFGGAITGVLAGPLYENDPGNKVDWPVIVSSTWTGAVNTDWFTAGNWSGGMVPDNTINVTIPLVTNNPIISGSSASCKDMTVTNGIVQLLGGQNLNIDGSLTLGTGTGLGTLVVEDATSVISVSGSWTRGTNGIFNANGSTVDFTATSGTVSITPLASSFGNLTFSGTAAFNLVGPTINVAGNFSQSAGSVVPSPANYIINIGGNLTRSGGTFNTSTVGTVVMNSAVTRTITGAQVNGLTIEGVGVKQTSGAVTVNGLLTVNGTIQALPASVITMNGNVTINTGGTFNGGTSTHIFTGLIWTGTGAYSTTGSTLSFNRVGGTQTLNASKFDNLEFAGTAVINLNGNVDVASNFNITAGSAAINLNTFLINRVGGPAGTFSVGSGRTINVLGANNFPSNFATYDLNVGSTTNYAGTADQTIRAASYGNLTLTNANTKSLGGNITVLGNLTLNTATLDVTPSNRQITLGGNFNNNLAGSFIARGGTIVFNGTATQNIAVASTGTKEFNRITVNKASGTVQPSVDNITLLGTLSVQGGSFSANSRTVSVGGDLSASSTGSFVSSGTFLLNRTSGTALIQMNGSGINNLTINAPAATYQAADNLTINGNFVLTAGIFQGSGRVVNVGNGAFSMSISGTYVIGAGGTLALGNGTSVTINAPGIFDCVGTSGNICYITRRTTGAYNFTVNGQIRARHYQFEWLGLGGLFISSGATINTTNNFSEGTFTNGTSGGTLLRIENTQNLTGANRIENVSFPANPGGGAFNVTKASATSGNIEFFNATGAFAGPVYENDPSNLIAWTGPVVLTWNGSVDTDWFNPSNWTPSSGPAIVPTAANDVVIPVTSNNPSIAGADAVCNLLTVNTGAVLSINSSTNTNTDLTIGSNLTLSGFLLMSSANDRIAIAGNWLRNPSGTFTPAQGTVVFNSTLGTRTINNGATAFFDVVIASSGVTELGANTTINGSLTINSGATLDASSFNRTLNLGGNLTNNGTIEPRLGVINLISSGINRTINGGASTLYDLTVNPTGGATYSIAGTLRVGRNLNIAAGTLDLNGNVLRMGGPSGTPSITITGTLEVDANAQLRLGTSATVNVNSGGTFRALGTSSSAVATITRTADATARYTFAVNAGGTLAARYYLFEHMDANGIQLLSGSTLDATNTLQDGTFSNGATGGRYILFANNLPSDRTIANVTFNSGAAVNARRVTGTNNVIFEDALGALGGFAFEQDDLAPSATAGLIRWNYTFSISVWNGSQPGGLWSDPLNWTPNVVPTSAIAATISNVGNPPIIDADAEVLNLTVNTGSVLTIQSDADLDVYGGLANAGTVTIAPTSNSNVNVRGGLSNTGTFNAGNNGTVTLAAATGIQTISLGSSNFRNLVINSAAPSTATFRTSGNLIVQGNISILNGTFTVDNPAHTVTVGGNWQQTGGTFNHGEGTVIFNAASPVTQTIEGINNFFNVQATGTGTRVLGSNLTIERNLTLATGSTFNFSTFTLNLGRNLTANGATIIPGTGQLTLNGTVPQTLSSAAGLSLNSLILNNTSASFPELALEGNLTINGTLTLTQGRIESDASNLVIIADGASMAGGSATSFVSGPVQRTGSSNFTYQIGRGSIYARLGLESIGSTSTFIASYIDGKGPALGSLSGGLERVSSVEYWDLNRSSGSGSPMVRLFWENGTRSYIGSGLAPLRVAHYTGAVWENLGGVSSGTTSAGSVVSTMAASSYSPFTFGTEDENVNPLPVIFSSFTATNTSNGVVLDWATLSEWNADYFAVERSEDGINYQTAGYVKAAGNSTTRQAYQFVDASAPYGKVYYRLRQVDLDGTNNFSERIFMNRTKEGGMVVEAWPNPVTQGKLNLRLNGLATKEMVVAKLINLLGETVTTFELTGDTWGSVETQLNLNEKTRLAKGFYFLSIQSANGQFSSKFFIE